MRTRGFRAVQWAAMVGIVLVAAATPGAVRAQTVPRYQSPLSGQTPRLQLPTLPTPTAITTGATVVEDVIVRVNDQVISRTDLEQEREQATEELRQRGASQAEIVQAQKDVLRDMIDQQLLLSKGKELDINPDAEVIRELDDIRKKNNLDSMEDLEKAAASQGYSFEDFKKRIRNSVITQQVVRDEVGRHLEPTQAQVQAYYEAHKSEFVQPEQVGLSEILIITPADASDSVLAQAQSRANEVEAKIKSGTTFEEAAKQYSGGPTASQGGELGLFKRGTLGQVLEDATFSLPVGAVTAPIRTRQGFVILKVMQHVASGVEPLKAVEPQVQEGVYLQALQPALRAYLTKLREDAYIAIKQGFVDSGASPNETTSDFTYTAYAPPAPKKTKKNVQKARLDRNGHVIAPTAAAAGTGTAPTTAPGATQVAAESGGPVKPSAPAGKVITGKKQKKVKREKIRFGQAPRTTLSAGPSSPTENVDPNAALPVTALAPGAAMTTAGSDLVAANNVDPNVNPLDPKPAPEKKTRFAQTAPYHSKPKPKKPTAKQKEKALATPTTMSADEKQKEQLQAAPLGLNGDTAKKKKKPKKVKGTPKERLKDKPVEAPAPVDQTVNPAIGASVPGTTPAPASAPAPGATPASK